MVLLVHIFRNPKLQTQKMFVRIRFGAGRVIIYFREAMLEQTFLVFSFALDLHVIRGDQAGMRVREWAPYPPFSWLEPPSG